MTAFLKQIARQYFADKNSLPGTLFVFPSRRAVAFFYKYLSEVVKENASSPVISPRTMTMDEFVLALSDLRKADRITLVLELYKCYCDAFAAAAVGSAAQPDSLDDFIFWADMILSDFNDIDKYLVDARDLLRNIAQYRQLKDDFSYLSETQRKAMEKFLGHFGRMGKEESLGLYKQRFADIWDLLFPIYTSFNEALTRKGLSYEGAVYRNAAQRIAGELGAELLSSVFPDCTRVVFCGLNALNECEKKIMDKLKRLSLAHFCWDYASPMISDSENRSSFFMKDNIARYGNDLALEPCNSKPQIEVISVSSAIAQAKLLDVIMKDPSVRPDETTAVMLADETLLLPVLSSIPPKVSKVNVTMGYPLVSSSFYSLLDDICRMTLRTRKKDGKTQIYHKIVWSIVGNNVFEALADKQTRDRVSLMKKQRRYFVDTELLSGTPLLDRIFMCPESDVESLRKYLLSVVDFIGQSIASDEKLKADMALEMDFAMECSRILNLLADVRLELSPAVWLHVFTGLLASTSIPFTGDPLCGLQIMGPLETRSLDFDNLIILSANEGVLPRRNVASSFIPPMLRKEFGLPTYEYQDAVWAYYFYRMIQRPSKVWMILDSRTDGLKSGEESRYIKQLKYHYGVPMVFRYASSAPEKCVNDTVVEKTPQIMEKLHSRPLSATSIKNYEDCPLKFYYSFIERLTNDDQVNETLDDGMIGNVLHDTMEDLFKEAKDKKVTVEFLEKLREDKDRITDKVRSHICDELKCEELRGREVIIARIIANNVSVLLGWDIELLKASGYSHFITRPECTVNSKIGNFELTGRMDRMDLFPDGLLRIVDYKTGKVDDKKFALQLFIYNYLAKHPKNPSSVPRFNKLEMYIYSTKSFSDGLPLPKIQNEELIGTIDARVREILEEMDNVEVPFNACEDGSACEYCDFSKICQKCSR